MGKIEPINDKGGKSPSLMPQNNIKSIRPVEDATGRKHIVNLAGKPFRAYRWWRPLISTVALPLAAQVAAASGTARAIMVVFPSFSPEGSACYGRSR